MSKFYGLIVRWLFVSRNGIKMHFLGVVGFKSSTLTVYYVSSWFIHQKRKTYSNLCVLCWLIHLSSFQGPKYIPPSFWPLVTNHALLHNFFMMLKSWAKNLKYLWRSYKDFGMSNMWAEYFKKSTRSSQSCNCGKNLQFWKNLGMFPHQDFEI